MNKTSIIHIILYLIGIALVICLIVIQILLIVKNPDELHPMPNEIKFTALLDFNFTENNSDIHYTNDNLGTTGNPIFDCYSGSCWANKLFEREYMDCEDGSCTKETETYYQNISGYDFSCSKECYDTGNKNCDCSYYYNNNKGICSRKTNDKYELGKYCLANNVIYYWKGKKYHNNSISNYSYLYDCVSKDEKCPSGKKDCGIVDNNENRLCLYNDEICPINYISDKKLEENDIYSTVILGDKTFYISRGANNKNTKIIQGLVVDTDLYLNNDNNKKDVIDTDTISGLLQYNKNLYKGINLGYDPYTSKDIDKKGKSYLRAYYLDKNIDLVKLKKEDYLYHKCFKYNRDQIESINDNVSLIKKMGFVNYGLLLICLVLNLILLGKSISIQKKEIISDKKKEIFCPLCCFAIFILLMITPLIFSFQIIKSLNEIDESEIRDELNSFSAINKIYIIFNFILILFLIIFAIIIYKCQASDSNKKAEEVHEQSSTVINTTINNNVNNIS